MYTTVYIRSLLGHLDDANLVMEDIEERALSSFYAPPRFWRRYVDDTCTTLPRDLVTSFYENLNSIDKNI